ncbi:MAG: MASE1 domain-containing protein [Novosphingobium meiothermophilum]|uniref:MASE1 domain-containing protein n=1 Tax=Novosphingobium TaxID=165696 RepID=UPI00137505FA|nr:MULTISPECIES: MASE1 domain-containing protein [Novosphingobium]
MRSARMLASPAALATAYFLAAAFAVAFARFAGGVAMVWLASAVLAGRLVHVPERRWPHWLMRCGLASALATGLFGLGWLAAVPFAAINMIEAAGAAFVWRRITRSFWPGDTLEWVASFYIGIGLMVPLLSGFLAATAAWVILDMPFIDNLTRWIIGHSLGLLSCLPVFHFIYARLSKGQSFLPDPRQLPMTLVVVGSFTLLTMLVFAMDVRALLVFPLAFFVVCAATLPSAVVTLLPILLILIGGAATAAQIGPIAHMEMDYGDQIQFFQLYVGVTVLTALPLMCERLRRVEEMRRMRARIAELEDRAGQAVPDLTC